MRFLVIEFICFVRFLVCFNLHADFAQITSDIDHQIKGNELETRKHSSRICTALFSDSGGSGLPTETTPMDRDPQTKTPLDRDLSVPLEGTWDQAARQEVTSYRNPTLWTN